MDYNSIANYIKSILGIDTPPNTIAAGAVALVYPKAGPLATSIGAYVNSAGQLVLPQGFTVPAGATSTNNGDTVVQTQVLAADGAITIKSGSVYITKSSAAALTLAAPTATVDDGKRLRVISTTAQAHTVTNTSPGFNNGSTASDVGTFGAAVGNSFECEAYQGVWYLVGTPKGVTFA